MNVPFDIAKYTKVVLLLNEEPLSVPEIKCELQKFNVEVDEIEILKALHDDIPKSERELIPSSQDKADKSNRSSYYKASTKLKREYRAVIIILNELMKADEKHISTLEDLFKEAGGRIDLHEIIKKMETEGLITYITKNANFISITYEGREYLNVFQQH